MSVHVVIPRRQKRLLITNGRYLWALLKRFYVTFVLAAVLYGFVPLLFVALYRDPAGNRIGFGEAMHHVYFLVFGQPSLAYVDNFWVEAMNLLIPPLGIAVVVDGIVRFAYLYFAKHRADKEWIEVLSQTMTGHVIICGAGRVGFRVATQLLALEKDVVVVEKKEDAAFVGSLRDLEVPVLIDDLKSPNTLSRLNTKSASAIVCATDDDLANLNTALDARRMNPAIRVVIRLFDDDLVAKVRDTFKAEALSSSALAAPAMALSALDPRIMHSFQVEKQLMVVSHFTAGTGLPGMSVSEVSDKFGALCLSLNRKGTVTLHPKADTKIEAGDTLTLQATYGDYLKMRAFTGEAAPPSSISHA